MGEPRYTKKEMVMARHEGFQRGARWREKVTTSGSLQPQVAEDVIVREAKKAFPLPRVERPRVVTDAEGHQWSFTGFPEPGALLMHRRTPGHGWSNNHPGITTENASVLAGLLSHPSEFVDDEG